MSDDSIFVAGRGRVLEAKKCLVLERIGVLYVDSLSLGLSDFISANRFKFFFMGNIGLITINNVNLIC
tara:strand:+ start:2062 stop:2265 length:204 start_codon:yes stop_codon:yes gene_type:complete